MRASTETLLSLFEWGALLGIDPWELAQFRSPREHAAQCESVWMQHQWQQDYLSREEVAGAIAAAEAAIADELGYWPAPVYTTETVEYPRPAPHWLTVPKIVLPLRWSKVHGGGVLARALIEPAAALVLSDEDGDGVNETFTVTVAMDVTDTSEIALYYTAADRNNAPLDETWRIRPVEVTVNGGLATIRGHAALLTKPALTFRVDAEALEPDDAANYVASAAVYRVYRDATATVDNPQQGVAIWDTPLNPCREAPCEQSSRPVCLVDRLTERAQARITPVAPSGCDHWRNPDSVRLHYLSGVPRVDGRMERQMAEIVARLATAWLPVEKCGCERSHRIISYWRALINADDTTGEPRPLTIEEVNNPFGPRRGAVWAWQRVQALKHGQHVGMI